MDLSVCVQPALTAQNQSLQPQRHKLLEQRGTVRFKGGGSDGRRWDVMGCSC